MKHNAEYKSLNNEDNDSTLDPMGCANSNAFGNQALGNEHHISNCFSYLHQNNIHNNVSSCHSPPLNSLLFLLFQKLNITNQT